MRVEQRHRSASIRMRVGEIPTALTATAAILSSALEKLLVHLGDELPDLLLVGALGTLAERHS